MYFFAYRNFISFAVKAENPFRHTGRFGPKTQNNFAGDYTDKCNLHFTKSNKKIRTNLCNPWQKNEKDFRLTKKVIMLLHIMTLYLLTLISENSCYATCISFTFSLILFSISAAISGLSSINCFTDSLPWPSLSLL